jgi:hypothetical protein
MRSLLSEFTLRFRPLHYRVVRRLEPELSV